MEFAWRYTGLRTQDLDAALRFYCDGLGMRVRFKFKIRETGGTIAELVSGDGKHFLELNYYPPGTAHASPYTAGEALDHLAFRVKGGATLEEAIAHLEAHGGTLRIAPFAESTSILAYVDSPDGHTIELTRPKPKPGAKAKPAPRAVKGARTPSRGARRAAGRG